MKLRCLAWVPVAWLGALVFWPLYPIWLLEMKFKKAAIELPNDEDENAGPCACCGAIVEADCTCLPVCPNCGDGHDDPCACIDCGKALCCGCAINQRCDDCDLNGSVEDDDL